MARAFGVDGLLARAAVFVALRHGFLQILQPGVGFGGGFLGRFELRLHLAQLLFVGRGQCLLVAAQTLAAQRELAALLFDVALVGGQHLDLLLHLHDGRALGVGLVLRALLGVFELRQAGFVFFELRGQQFGLLLGVDALPGQRFEFDFGIFTARVPLADLFAQLHQPLLDALPPFDDEADLAFEPPDFAAGFIQPALRLIDQIARAVMRLAHGFELGFDAPQIGGARFEVVQRLAGIGLDARLIGLAFGALQEPQLMLLARGVAGQRVVALRDFGLLFEAFQIGVELAQDVFDAGQVFARVAEAVLGFAAALLVFRDAGRFFEEQPQFLGFGFDDPADRALADDRVGARAETGAEEHVLHVAAAHRLVVDEVAAGAVARQHTAHRDFGEQRPLAAGPVVGVVEHQFHTRTARLLARRRAVEDHVLHRLAAQFRCARLAQHPAHRIHDVRLAAAVRPHHAD